MIWRNSDPAPTGGRRLRGGNRCPQRSDPGAGQPHEPVPETVVDITGEEQAALRSGRADVVTGSFADPQELRDEGCTVDSLLVADQFPMYGPTLVTTERTLRERQQALERFLVGTVTGWAEAVENPETAVRAVASDDTADERGLDNERRTFERAAAEFATRGAVAKHGWGWQRAAGWDRLVTALDQADLLAEPL